MAMKGEIKISAADHPQAVEEEMSNRRKTRDDVNGAKLEGIVNNLNAFEPHILIRAKQTVSWMTTWSNTVTGTVISAMEFSDLCVC